MQHANAPLAPNGRLRIVLLVEEEGFTFEAAAATSNVAKSTTTTSAASTQRSATGHPAPVFGTSSGTTAD
jgi:hypothetical protein